MNPLANPSNTLLISILQHSENWHVQLVIHFSLYMDQKLSCRVVHIGI